MNVHVYEGSHTTLAAFERTVHLVVAWSLLTGDEHTQTGSGRGQNSQESVHRLQVTLQLLN